MALLTVSTDINIIRETVEYFRDLGFSEQYVSQIERDLLEQEVQVMSMLELPHNPVTDKK